ncbi:UNVERIFIED_CONTAM: hypothetical protein N8J90_13880 [Halobacillus marinus]|uniref:hypothetical protein n=1 Tax=Bacillaceae TaxID=186817 RepID=UPI0002A4EE9C|nr:MULTISPECIES: hypothetical protein [Bacillaceae]ELK47168.1 hypothetical protein D479_06942 [Halobacillus sp. BAB-2008]QHT47328.1 hypothetical protein M662_12800 [Bacillus sp. SB49]
MLESINQLGVLLFLLCGFAFYLHLRRIKKKRGFTFYERIMYVTVQLAYLLWAGSYLLMMISEA